MEQEVIAVKYRRDSLVPRPFPPPVFDRIQYAIKNWRRERPGNEATDVTSRKLSLPYRGKEELISRSATTTKTGQVRPDSTEPHQAYATF